MPTREVLSEFAKSDPDATGVGPVHEHSDHVPQSLLDRHKDLAAKPNKATHDSSSSKDSNRAPQTRDRVRSTGATSPHSLLAEIRAQMERTAKAHNANNGEDEGEHTSTEVKVSKD